MYADFLNTSVGLLKIQSSEVGITNVIFIEETDTASTLNNHSGNSLTGDCKQQLNEYFAGKRQSFNFPLDQQGTDFQKAVWACLSTIPFGETVSYQDIANMLNKPKAVRAVGAANGKNPISIIVPCHRVIGSNRSLTGYAGGLKRKLWLLKHEGISFSQGKIVENECQIPLLE